MTMHSVFFYQDNLELLQEMGAELIPFSPLYDKQIPGNLSGLLFYGGYPELYAEELSKNESMKTSIKKRIERRNAMYRGVWRIHVLAGIYQR